MPLPTRGHGSTMTGTDRLPDDRTDGDAKMEGGQPGPSTSSNMIGGKGTKLHCKSPTAERRHVWCVAVGGD
jgi:hypothetical protein